jgi:glycosyltransferase involved in cell wall biosynthesis
MALTEKDRNWPYKPGQDLGFPYAVHKGIHPNPLGITWHLNPGLVSRAIFESDDVTIMAGSWLVPSSLLVSFFRQRGLRIFWSESHAESTRHKGFLVTVARRIFLSFYDGFCFPNDRAIEWLKQYVYDIDKKVFFKLPNLVNENLFSKEVIKRKDNKIRLRGSYNIHQGDLILLCPARLMERKGIRAFFSAVRDCPFKNVTILIAGDGPDRKKLEEFGRTMKAIKTCFLGFCNEEKMLDLYALSDMLLLPSFEDPNPLSVIEACHAGLPLLISRQLGNYPEALLEKENGWGFDPHDPSSMIQALDSAVKTSREKLEIMGSCSSKIGEQNFSTRKTVAQFVDALEKSF